MFNIDTAYQTPSVVCEYMVDLIPSNAITILEPTPGLGNIVSELNSRNKYKVITPSDFFLLDPTHKYDCIVMNPPFSDKSGFIKNAQVDRSLIKGMKLGYYILTECMKRTDNVIALMPWFTISDSDVRLRHIKAYGLKSITPLPRKTFDYARIQTMVVELERGYEGSTTFNLINF